MFTNENVLQKTRHGVVVSTRSFDQEDIRCDEYDIKHPLDLGPIASWRSSA